ncbi:acyl carrier protein [Thermomonas sp.]
MSQEIADQVLDIVAKHVDGDRATLTREATLKDLGVDSLGAIETIFDIEEHFDINFPDRDPNLDDGTIGSLISAVEGLLSEKAAGAAAVAVAPAAPAN